MKNRLGKTPEDKKLRRKKLKEINITMTKEDLAELLGITKEDLKETKDLIGKS